MGRADERIAPAVAGRADERIALACDIGMPEKRIAPAVVTRSVRRPSLQRRAPPLAGRADERIAHACDIGMPEKRIPSLVSMQTTDEMANEHLPLASKAYSCLPEANVQQSFGQRPRTRNSYPKNKGVNPPSIKPKNQANQRQFTTKMNSGNSANSAPNCHF
jgi:hypothetical protein